VIKGLIKDSLAYSFSNIVSHGVSLLLLPFFTRVLAPADYGVMDILQMFTSVVKITVPLEIYQALARFYIDSTDDKTKIAYSSNALWVTTVNYGIFVLASIIFAKPLSLLILQSSDYSGVFSLCAVAIATNGIFFLLQVQSRYNFKSASFLVSSMIFVVVSSSVTAAAVLWLRVGIRGIYYGQIAGAATGMIFSLIANRSCYRFTLDFSRLRVMLSFSAPLIPSSLGLFISSYIDRVAIQRMMSLSDVGVYGIAARFSSLTSLLLLGFGSALNPLIYRHYRDPETRSKISRLFTYFITAAIVVTFFFLSYSREILSIFATSAYRAAEDVIPVLVVGAFVSSMYLFNPGLPIEKKTGILSLINILGAAVNIVLNLLCIPLLGIMGAAIASVGDALVVYFLNYVFSQKYYRIQFEWKKLAPALLMSGASAAALVLAWRHQAAVGLLARTAIFFAIAACTTLFLAGRDLKRFRQRRVRGS
jgi:O-antigen/teichoic acid export membrane protein